MAAKESTKKTMPAPKAGGKKMPVPSTVGKPTTRRKISNEVALPAHLDPHPDDSTLPKDETENAPKGAIKVVAIQEGYYDHVRRKEGDKFVIHKQADFSKIWMEKI